jgi:hypothetical protein
VHSTEEALETLGRHRIDLAIVDLETPGTPAALEVARRIAEGGAVILVGEEGGQHQVEEGGLGRFCVLERSIGERLLRVCTDLLVAGLEPERRAEDQERDPGGPRPASGSEDDPTHEVSDLWFSVFERAMRGSGPKTKEKP